MKPILIIPMNRKPKPGLLTLFLLALLSFFLARRERRR